MDDVPMLALSGHRRGGIKRKESRGFEWMEEWEEERKKQGRARVRLEVVEVVFLMRS